MALDTSKPVLQTVGNYDLLEKVAEGGMGSVYRAKQRGTDQIVAIKIMPPHMAGNAESRQWASSRSQSRCSRTNRVMNSVGKRPDVANLVWAPPSEMPGMAHR